MLKQHFFHYSQHEREKQNLEREERELIEAQHRLIRRQRDKRQSENFQLLNIRFIIFILEYHFHLISLITFSG